MRIRLNQFILCSVGLIVGLLSFAITETSFLTLLAVCMLIAGQLSEKKNEQHDYVLYSCFNIGIFIFCFGQLLVYYLFPSYSFMRFIVIERLSADELHTAAQYALIIYAMFNVGYALYNPKASREIIELSNEDEQDQLRVCFHVGLALFAITIVPSLIYEYDILKTSYISGYIAGRGASNVVGIADDVAQLCRTSILMLIIGSKNKKKRATFFLLVFVGFFLLKMFIYGERGYAAINIIVYVWAYRSYVYKEKIHLSIRNVFEIIGLLIIFAIIGELRENSISTWRIDEVNTILANNVFTRELVEFGGTLLTVGYIMKCVPSVFPFAKGGTFVAAILGMLPNNVINIEESSFISPTNIIHMARGRQSSLGECFIADLYYNFGYFGVLGGIMFGILMAALIYRISVRVKMHFDPILLVCYIRAFSILLWLIRGSIINVGRELEFAVLPVLIIYLLLNNRSMVGYKKKREY